MSEPMNDTSLHPYRAVIAPTRELVEYDGLVRRDQAGNFWEVARPLRVWLPGLSLRSLASHGWRTHGGVYIDVDAGFRWNGVGGRRQWPLRDAPPLVLASGVHDILCERVAVKPGRYAYACPYLARHAVYRQIARTQGDPAAVAWTHWGVLVSVNWFYDILAN